jgi:isopenicillin N synthase-like dioxygenase
LTRQQEHLDIGAAVDPEFKNKWPEESLIPNFREDVDDYYLTLESYSYEILQQMEEGMNVPKGTFLDQCSHKKNSSELRLNHYPPVNLATLDEGSVSRIWPHFDFGIITLLTTAGTGGLEVEDRTDASGAFIPIEPSSPFELIVNISETMQRWTNGVLPAGLHQVTVPRNLEQHVKNGVIGHRYSVAYLCKADRHASLTPLRAFLKEGEEPHEEITALDYHKKRLRSIIY